MYAFGGDRPKSLKPYQKLILIVAICAFCSAAAIFSAYQAKLLGDPGLRALLQSEGADAYTNTGEIDEQLAAQWSQRIDTDVAPYWFWCDFSLGSALGLISILVLGLIGDRWRDSQAGRLNPAMLVGATVLATVLLVLSLIPMVMAAWDRGLVPDYDEAGGRGAVVAVVVLLLPGPAFTALVCVLAIQLRQKVILPKWSLGQIVLKLLLAIVSLPMAVLAGLSFLSPYSALPGGLLWLILAEIMLRYHGDKTLT